MPRFSPRILLATGVLATSFLTFMDGCADNESMLFVSGVVAWPRSGDCIITPDSSSPMLLGGVLDLAFGDSYVAPLLVGNQLTRRGNREQLRTESSRVSLRGSVVRISDQQGNKISEYTTDGTGFVDPAEGDTPGYGIVSSTLIPSGLFNTERSVVVNVRVFGDSLGGEELESNELTFPITICRGCLILFENKAVDPASGECVGTDDPQTALPCAIGQDDPVDCRYCYGRVAECQRP